MVYLQVTLQGQASAARHIVINVPHAVSDNGVPHQLPLTSKLLNRGCVHCLRKAVQVSLAT